VDRIADRCTEVETGARNIDHIMQGTILSQLSHKILESMAEEEMPTDVRLGVADGGTFGIEFSSDSAESAGHAHDRTPEKAKPAKKRGRKNAR
jgi:ATP-dependent Clp protease ATP-binding subunit ClpA